jgi:hypothetical protein
MKLVDSCSILVLSYEVLPKKSWYDSIADHFGRVMDVMAQGMFLSDNIKFLLLITILLMIHIASSVILSIGNKQSAAAVPRDVLSSHLDYYK